MVLNGIYCEKEFNNRLLFYGIGVDADNASTMYETELFCGHFTSCLFDEEFKPQM